MSRRGTTRAVQRLPHCDPLFLRFFDRWYSAADRKRKVLSATRPDMLRIPEDVGRKARELSPLTGNAQAEAVKRIKGMVAAAQGDWPRFLNVRGQVSLDWIKAFDKYYNRGRIKALIDRSDPDDFTNDYLVTCCEFGAVLGHVMRRLKPRLEWYPEWPYWESSVFDPRTGYFISVFHWAIKKMSGYGVDDGYVSKTVACLERLDPEVQPA